MDVVKRNPRRQGDLGEQSAVAWMFDQGWPVFVPFGHSPDVDLITVWDSRAVRVQVKTSTVLRQGRWDVTLCTRGGNRSWSGLVKRLDPTRYDYLFVLVGDGRRWFIPAGQVGGNVGLRLGGPKYAGFEIDPGRPILFTPSSLD